MLESSSSVSASPSFSAADILLQISRDLEQYKAHHAEPIVKVPKSANIGNDYKHFKPITKHSLYSCIILDPDSIEEVAKNWVYAWQSKPEEATISMLQLFIDTAGFQNYSVKKDYGKQNYDQMLAVILKDVPSTLHEYGYLLQGNTNWTKQAIASLSTFVTKVVAFSENKGALFEDIFHDILEFLKTLCKNDMKSFKHTGIFFATLFCVAVGEIVVDHAFIVSKLEAVVNYNTTYRAMLSSKLERGKTEHLFCLKHTEFLATNILNECTVHDPYLEELHTFCAKKIVALYFMLEKPEYQHRVITVLIDYAKYFASRQTRIAAIKSFESFFKDRRFQNVQNDNVTRILAMLYDKTLDEDLEVSIQALKSLTAAVIYHPGILNSNLLNKLFLFVYNKHYAIAKEAGHLFMVHVRHYTRDNLKEAYVEMVKFQSLRMFEGLAAHFVESVFEAAPELTNPEVAIKLLLEETLEFREEVALLDIVAHTFVQITVGKSLNPRDDSIITNVKPFVKEKIFSQILPKLPILCEKYKNEAECLKSLLIIMTNMPYEDNAVIKYQVVLSQMLKLYNKIFITTNDEEIMIRISEVLHFSSSEISPVQVQSSASLKCILEKCYKDYEEYLSQSEWTEDIQSAVNNVLLRLAAIRKYHRPTQSESFTPLRNKRICDDQMLVSDLKCEFSFFLQTLQMFEENEDSRDVSNLKNSYNSLVDSCCNYLSFSKSLVNKIIILENFLDMCIVQGKCMKASSFSPTLTKSQLMTFCLCIKTRLTNYSVSSTRLIRKIMDNMYAIPLNIMLYTWAFYNKLYNLYGQCYDQYLKAFYQESAATSILTFMIITAEYKGLTYDGITACENLKELEKLSLQLSRITPRKQLVRITQSLVNYAAGSYRNMAILDQAKYFCNRLTKPEENFLINNIVTIFQGTRMDHEKVQDLLKYLKKHENPAHSTSGVSESDMSLQMEEESV